jgi:hypothetical protein
VLRLLDLPLAAPVHDFNISHNPAGQLLLDFYHANGRHKVAVLPDRLRIEAIRAPLGRYVSILHETTARFRSADPRLQLWACYNEFAMWMLGVLVVTGAWLAVKRIWLRGTVRRIHWVTGILAVPVLAIFTASAIQMAHRTWWWRPSIVWNLLAGWHRGRGMGVVLPSAGTLVLLTLAATGLVLWYRGRERRVGSFILGAGAVLSGGLFVWMRNW